MSILVLCLVALVAVGVVVWLWLRDLKRLPDHVDKILRDELKS